MRLSSEQVGFDAEFLRRTYRTSAWVLLLVLFPLVSYGFLRAAWSVAAGAALGLGVLRTFEWLVTGLVEGRRKRVGWWMAQVSVLKLPLLAALLYGVVRSGWFHLPAFAGGVVLTQAVILLRAVGAYLTAQEQERAQKAPADLPGKPARSPSERET